MLADVNASFNRRTGLHTSYAHGEKEPLSTFCLLAARREKDFGTETVVGRSVCVCTGDATHLSPISSKS